VEDLLELALFPQCFYNLLTFLGEIAGVHLSWTLVAQSYFFSLFSIILSLEVFYVVFKDRRRLTFIGRHWCEPGADAHSQIPLNLFCDRRNTRLLFSSPGRIHHYGTSGSR